MYILPYKNGSASAKSLAEALGVKQIRNTDELKPFRKKHRILNWGCSSPKRTLADQQIINSFEAVSKSVDKLVSFKIWQEAGVPIPPFSEEREWAAEALLNDSVVCRTVLRGYGGEGIVIATTPDELVDAPLYVRYVPKNDEYRLHVANEEVFFVQRKARRLEVPDEEVNWKVRNLAGGFIYANQNVEVSEEVKQAAIMAVQALGLDFGAVDVIQNKRDTFVLEVNTACGLAGTTLDRYAEALSQYS